MKTKLPFWQMFCSRGLMLQFTDIFLRNPFAHSGDGCQIDFFFHIRNKNARYTQTLKRSSGCCSTDLRNVLAFNVTDINMSPLYCVLFSIGAFCVDALCTMFPSQRKHSGDFTTNWPSGDNITGCRVLHHSQARDNFHILVFMLYCAANSTLTIKPKTNTFHRN